MIDDIIISRAILKRGFEELLKATDSKVVIVGAGPSRFLLSCKRWN
jgi:ribulose 1,5-bisphosphate synthetase/thiazole synthase